MTSPDRTFLPSLAWVPAQSAWLGLFAVAVVFGMFAAVHALWPASAEGAVQDATPAQPPLVVAPPRVRCETCGIVEAIDRTEAVDGRPAAWVFSVRLPDGSLRRSPDALRGRWQLGDGMLLIGGERS